MALQFGLAVVDTQSPVFFDYYGGLLDTLEAM